jgi:hypothetical protein
MTSNFRRPGRSGRARLWTLGALAAALVAAPGSSGATQSEAAAAAAPPGTATIVPIQVTGTTATRFNLVIMGDGYTEAEFPKFLQQVDKHLNTLWSIEPYKSYKSYMNVYAIEIVSADSGVDCDPNLNSGLKNTPLSMGFWGGCSASSVQRLISVNNTAATTYANMVAGTTSANRQILAIANSNTYGGAGGTFATASGGNALSALISPHELGHSLGGLQDEYDYLTRGVAGGTYSGGEPTSVHHTILTAAQMTAQQKKWYRWLGEPSESGGTIGVYQGGMYLRFGVWRPSQHSIMKTLGYYYDQIGREVMTRAISAKVSLTQANTATTSPIGADRVVWVETLHPVREQLAVTWTVDGVDVPNTNNSRNLDLATLGLAPGTHTLKMTVVDPTDFVRDPAIRASSALTQTRTWTVNTALTTTPVAVAPAFTSSTPTDKPVAANGVVFAEPTHPTSRVLDITWRLDGGVVSDPGNNRDLDLSRFGLTTGTHALTATVTDPADPGGASQTLTWSVDATEPTTSYTLSTPAATIASPGQPVAYYFNGPFTMKLTGTDDNPGFVVTEYRVDGDGWQNFYGWPTDSNAGMLFTEYGTNIDDLYYGKLGVPRAVAWDTPPSGQGRHTIEYRGKDEAGNVAAAQSFVVDLDMIAPVSTASLAPAAVGGWYSGPALTLAATDENSGVTTTMYAIDGGPFTVYSGPLSGFSDGPHSVQFFSTDLAGNVEATQTISFQVDSTAPSTTASLAPASPTGSNGWYLGAVPVTLAATDAGSGVASTMYSVDGGATATYAGPFTVTGDGAHAVQFWSVDNAGNVGVTQSVVVKVDLNNPTSSASISPVEQNGWYASPSVTLTGADGAGSGIAKLEYLLDSGSWTVYTGPVSGFSTGDHVIQYRATDVAGRVQATAGVLAFKADAVRPSVTVTAPADGAVYPLDKLVTAKFKCTDAQSGVGTCVGTVANGANLATGTIGSHAFTVTATDKAGNVTTVTNHYTVVYTWNGFFSPITNSSDSGLNLVHAGDLVKLGFSLNGNRGLSVGTVTSVAVACPSWAPHTVPAGGAGTTAGLSYGVASGHYTYGWQTSTTWAGSCRQFQLTLNDGTPAHTATFMFFA